MKIFKNNVSRIICGILTMVLILGNSSFNAYSMESVFDSTVIEEETIIGNIDDNQDKLSNESEMPEDDDSNVLSDVSDEDDEKNINETEDINDSECNDLDEEDETDESIVDEEDIILYPTEDDEELLESEELMVESNNDERDESIDQTFAQHGKGKMPLYSPQKDADVTKWDCIYYGNYWQEDTNGDGVADEKDDKQPIKWRVLNVNRNKAFIVADKVLDNKPWHITEKSIYSNYWDAYWSGCTLRDWLNGYSNYSEDGFLNNAFTSSEIEGIRTNSIEDTGTCDSVFLLSRDEVLNSSYGFFEENLFNDYSCGRTRSALATSFATNRGVKIDYNQATWALRTHGDQGRTIHFIHTSGFASSGMWDGYCTDYYGIRPAMYIDTSKCDYDFAGTVTSDGVVDPNDSLQKYVEDDSFPKEVSINSKINYSGYGVACFLLKDSEGYILTNHDYYFLQDGTEVSGQTDEDGYAYVYTGLYTYDDENLENNTRHFYTDVWTTSRDNPIAKVTITSIITPLSYSQEWKGKMEAGVDASIGPKAGATLGQAEVSAGLAELSGGVSRGGVLSINDSYSEDGRTLFLKQTYSNKLGINGGLGPKAKAVFGGDLEVSLADVSVGLGVGESNSVGLEVKNYDPHDANNLLKVGNYLLCVYGIAKGNVFVFDLARAIGIDITNYSSNSISFNGSEGIDFLSAKTTNSPIKGKVSVVSEEAGFAGTYEIEKKSDDSIERKYSISTNASVDLLKLSIGPQNVDKSGNEYSAVIKSSYFEDSIDGDFSVATKSKNDKLENVSYDFSLEKEGGGQFFTQSKELSREVSFEGENAEIAVSDIEELKDFSEGNSFILWPNIVEEINSIGFDGKYTDYESTNQIIDIPIELGFKIGVGIKAKYDLCFENKLSYAKDSGQYYNGLYIPTAISSDDIGEIVERQKKDLVNILAEPFSAAEQKASDYIDTQSGTCGDVIENGESVIEFNSDEVLEKDLQYVDSIVVSTSTLSDQIDSLAMANSYDIYTFDEVPGNVENLTSGQLDELSQIQATVGKAYVVSAVDAEGKNVDDFSVCPLKLTLSYDEDMLAAAGAKLSDARALKIYRYSEDVLGYVYVGGEVDTSTQSVRTDILLPGEYILVLDAVAPIVQYVSLSDDSVYPQITVAMDDFENLLAFSLSIDDSEVVNLDSYKPLYNANSRSITYSCTDELSIGEHTLKIYAEDVNGNKMPAPYTETFTVVKKAAVTGVGFAKKNITLEPGGSETLEVNVYPSDATDTSVIFESTDSETVSVDGDGKITAIKEGKAEITVTTTDGKYTDKCEVTVKKSDVEEEDIPEGGEIPEGMWIAVIKNPDTEDGKFYYTGKAIKPSVRVYDNTSLLTAGKDYSVSYSNNTKAGEHALITISGKGNYSGKEKTEFVISPADISGSEYYAEDIMVKYAAGKTITPKVALLKDGKALSAKNDFGYTIYAKADTEKNNPLGTTVTESGDYTILISGKGNYTGERSISFAVTENLKSVSGLKIGKIAAVNYTGEAIEPKPVISDGKTPLHESTTDVEGEYTLSYSNNTNVGTGYIVIKGNPDKGYTGTKRISFKINGRVIKSPIVIGIPASAVYTGSEITFDNMVVAMDKGSTVLNKENDYDIIYTKNQNVGKATIEFKGKNGYTGSVKKTFTIKAYPLTDEKITVDSSAEGVYSKAGVKNTVKVTFAGTVLKEGTDYTLSYVNNKKADVPAKVTIKGKGNFTGSIVKEFTVAKADIGKSLVTAEDKVYQEKANIFATKITVYDNGKALKAGTDYDKNIEYRYLNRTRVIRNGVGTTVAAGNVVDAKDIIPADTVIKVKVTGKGYYEGTQTGTYRIMKNSISKAKVTVKGQTYTGAPILLTADDITVKVGDELKLYDKSTGEGDFIITDYEKNVNKGAATAKIKGIGNYGGEKKITFKIGAKGLLWWFRGLM